MNIKVNGAGSMKQLEQLDGLNIDFAGIFFSGISPRNFQGRLTAKEADLDVRTVGIFEDASLDSIREAIELYELDLVQLGIDADPALCGKISRVAEVIKVFSLANISTQDLDLLLHEFDEVCDYYLFDGFSASNGKAWDVISGCHIEKPFFLGGDLTAADGGLVRKFKHPDFYAVDLGKSFEKEAGILDMASILQFKSALK